MAREYFNAYHSYLKSIDPLNDAERGRLFTALLFYSSTGKEPELRGNERFIFPMMREQIDRDCDKYNKKCESNRQNIKVRWNTNEYERIPDDTKNTKEKEKTKEKTKTRESINGASAPRSKFVKPTVDEVRAYCKERKNTVNPETFCDFYESKGWKIGKDPMRDWKAAVRTWERREPQTESYGTYNIEDFEAEAMKELEGYE